MDPAKKIIQCVKNMSNFKDFLSIGSQPMWSHTFEKKEMIILERKKIISGKILVVRFTQMDIKLYVINSFQNEVTSCLSILLSNHWLI